jgi:outer membrane protein OmpA-like peptidoglycan-associated protein
MIRTLAAVAAALTITGCGTLGTDVRRDVHTIPVPRDYSELQEVELAEAEAAVAEALRLGAPATAPYPYFAAEAYLANARGLRKAGDKRGAWDYAGLAVSSAREAQAIAGEAQLAEPIRRNSPQPASFEAAQERFQTLRERYGALGQESAQDNVPVLYARLTAALSRAEHDICLERGWKRAHGPLDEVETLLTTLEGVDPDADGIAYAADAAPVEPEDFDGFEDDDGAPDLDNDLDGIPDVLDAAPDAAETANRYRDYDGAPDTYPELEPVFFDSGSATILSEGRGYLQGILVFLKEWPAIRLRIAGYTDDTHSRRYAMDLSRRRAQTIHRYLLQLGVPEEQMSVTFHGSADPRGDNDTPGGRALNRRVELTLE